MQRSAEEEEVESWHSRRRKPTCTDRLCEQPAIATLKVVWSDVSAHPQRPSTVRAFHPVRRTATPVQVSSSALIVAALSAALHGILTVQSSSSIDVVSAAFVGCGSVQFTLSSLVLGCCTQRRFCLLAGMLGTGVRVCRW